jgi:hypothetical protein
LKGLERKRSWLIGTRKVSVRIAGVPAGYGTVYFLKFLGNQYWRNNSPVQHIYEIEDAVEHGHEQVGDAQVHQEVVGDRAHPAVRCNTKQMSGHTAVSAIADRTVVPR